jgi:hypothetical protein
MVLLLTRVLKYLALAVLGVLFFAVAVIGVARALLPNTSCAVTRDKIDALVLENMSYADVKGVLGCDGILVAKEDLGEGQYVFETYQWRGDVWPYGWFGAKFINGKMHETNTYWFKLDLSGNKT